MGTAASGKAKFGEELVGDATTFTGAYQSLGSFSFTPVIVVIQNDTNQTVTLSDDAGATDGISFVSGTRLVLDMRANNGNADFFSFPANAQLAISAPVGTGEFKIAYLYAEP